jgi:hypothetical protein
MKPTEFLASVQSLFAEIEPWASAKGLHVKRDSVQLNEEAYGAYQADTLQILTETGQKIAEFVPIGASIIGAKGRVDLVGTIDSVILADWDKGGPSIMTAIDDGATKHSNTVKVYRNVGDAGWYWVESRKLARAHRFDERLFFDLLPSVSDYEPSN